MESATSIGFTNTAKGDLTLVFVEPNATVKVDGTKYTANGDGIIQVSVSAGTHTITKAEQLLQQQLPLLLPQRQPQQPSMKKVLTMAMLTWMVL